MVNRLFIYGTLAPGRPNEHILAEVKGDWQQATVKGRLLEAGWGASLGYPGIVLDESANNVDGFVFTSNELDEHWAMLDEFEGDGYQRVLTSATYEDGSRVEAYVYSIKTE